MRNDSIQKTLLVALAVCVVCSIVVSTTAVVLRPLQEANRINDRKKFILVAAGVIDPQTKDDLTPDEIVSRFDENIEEHLIDVRTGERIVESDLDPVTFDMRKAAKAPEMSVFLSSDEDIAGIKRRSNYRKVYLKMGEDDGREQIERIILPVHGKGLWGTLYGYLALDADGQTIRHLAFYEHVETPGLGGEVDNPRWKEQWDGKVVYDEEGDPAIRVIKGEVDPDNPQSKHQVSAISGATITSRGVENTVHFWLGESGYAKFLERLKAGEFRRETST